MNDIEDIIYDDYIPILDDDADEYLDAEIDELCCEGDTSIGAMLDAEIESLQESGILNESLELVDPNGNPEYSDEDEDDDDDESDDTHYYIDDNTGEDDEDDGNDYVNTDPDDHEYASVGELSEEKEEE